MAPITITPSFMSQDSYSKNLENAGFQPKNSELEISNKNHTAHIIAASNGYVQHVTAAAVL